MVDACCIVVAASCGVPECVVGIIYYLEFLGAFGAFWGLGGDAVGGVFVMLLWFLCSA